MRALFTTLFVFAAAFMLWRTMRPQRSQRHLQMVSPSQLPLEAFEAEEPAKGPYKWPSLGLFNFPVVDGEQYQAALKEVSDGTPVGTLGTQVLAELHTGESNPDIWKPVEVRVHNRRVGYLSKGDATRFQRRLAYEGRAGQTTCCDALIRVQENGGHALYVLHLDLKQFRH
jgi:hypothetical protein